MRVSSTPVLTRVMQHATRWYERGIDLPLLLVGYLLALAILDTLWMSIMGWLFLLRLICVLGCYWGPAVIRRLRHKELC